MSDERLIALLKHQRQTLQRIKKALRRRNLLPKELREMKIEVRPNGQLAIVAGFHECGGYISWTAVPFSDFSQTLTSIEDLERIVLGSEILRRFIEKYGREEGIRRFQEGEELP